ncbi:MAG: anti-sigma factor [Planctomycetes bacterium]|nr:anti-sigma factor [Planctomycetota bacterium]
MNESDDNFEFSELSLEVAAAELSIALAELDSQPSMPQTLRSKLDQLASDHIAATRARRQEASADSYRFQSPVAVSDDLAAAPSATTQGAGGLNGWIPPKVLPFVRTLSTLAAAACILVGVGIFYYSVSQSPMAKRDALAARAGSADGVVIWSWTAWTKEADARATSASGDVVWDTSEQSGYMTFAGLPPIDADSEVYQLWIIDADRPGEHPVDGGTFTASGTSPVIVPFHARVKVGRPAAFAVTIEKPGGAVVSDQKRKLTIAAPPRS